MNNKITHFITTPIFYPSDKLHIGHLYTCVLADVFKKFQDQKGNNCFFTTGSDNHGEKIVKSAAAKNIEIEKYVKMNVSNFLNLWEKYDINYNRFVQTNAEYHKKTVHKILDRLYQKKLIYYGDYFGKYCVHCEEYFTEFQIINNKCNSCKRDVKNINEKNYFLKISNYKDWIVDEWKDNTQFIYPSYIITELTKNFIDNNFQNLCISRKKFGWGLELPFDSKYSVYVWFDALLNYLSVTGYANEKFDEWKTIWENNDTRIVHILGKEITRFHCIYWPIILKMNELRMPNQIIAHSWITTSQGKMSKSIGNVVDPLLLLNEFTSDTIRFFLISQISLDKDYLYTHKKLVEIHNSFLANIIGNLYKRINTMYLTFFNDSDYFSKKNTINNNFTYYNDYKMIVLLLTEYNASFNNLQYKNGIEKIISIGIILNKFIEEKKPWSLNILDNKIELQEIFIFLLIGLKIITFALKPILTKGSKVISKSFDFNYNDDWISYLNLNNHIKSIPILYKRIK